VEVPWRLQEAKCVVLSDGCEDAQELDTRQRGVKKWIELIELIVFGF
jgi:hypothetical protein